MGACFDLRMQYKQLTMFQELNDGIHGLMFLGDQILMLLEYISVVYITLYNMLNGLILRSARGVTFSHLLNSCK